MREATSLGKVHVITGAGKGKTTAAFGMAMRAAGHGLKVCIIQFMKSGEISGEFLAAAKLPTVEVTQYGTGSFVNPNAPSAEDAAMAKKAVDHAVRVARSGECDLLVLDEVNVAANLGLVEEGTVLDMLEHRADGVEVVLTGRNAPDSFIDSADYVTVVQKEKHPFDDGATARKGIEW